MRNQSRLFHLLLLRTHHNQSQLLRSFSSIPLRFITNQSKFPINPNFRNFSSKPEADTSLIIDIFSKSRNFDEVKNQLDSNQLSISDFAVNCILPELGGSDPVSARIFFQWVLENYPEKLTSESYNQFLGCLGINGAVEEFWDLIRVMKEKDFGVSKRVIDMTLEYFEKNGMDADAFKLKELFDKETPPPAAAERIQISKLKQLLEEKEQCILQHKQQEKKFKRQILHDNDMKLDQSTLLMHLIEKRFNMFESIKEAIEVLEIEFQDMYDELEKHFAETEERCGKILADCSEESTRQQLMMHIQQGQSEQFTHLRETAIAMTKDFDWAIQRSKYLVDEVLHNDENAKIQVKNDKENETMSVERIQIMESDMTISKLKQLLQEKQRCILQHKEQEKKFKFQILHGHYMKQGQWTVLKRLRKNIFDMSRNFEAAMEGLESYFRDKYLEQEKHFTETEERCRKILADCSEESTKQQLMMHIQQGHSEQLKHLRETTIAVWKDFDRRIQIWKVILYDDCDMMLEQDMPGVYYQSNCDSD